MKTVCVTICTIKPTKEMEKAIKSIMACHRLPDEFIIVDQSDLNPKEVIELSDEIWDKINWIKQDVKGVSKGKNLAIKTFKSDILALTDDDAYVNEDWIDAIIETFSNEHYKTGIVGGKIIPVYDEINPDFEMPEQFRFILPAYDQGDILGKYNGADLPPGANYAVSRRAIEKVGLFDENIGPTTGRNLQIYGEEGDFTVRVRNSGFDVVYNPKSIVYHPVTLQRQNHKWLKERLAITGTTREYARKKNTKKSFKERLKDAVNESLFTGKGIQKYYKIDKFNYWIFRGRLLFLLREMFGMLEYEKDDGTQFRHS